MCGSIGPGKVANPSPLRTALSAITAYSSLTGPFYQKSFTWISPTSLPPTESISRIPKTAIAADVRAGPIPQKLAPSPSSSQKKAFSDNS